MREPVELHQLQQLVHFVADHALRSAGRARLHAQAERDVLEHGHVAEQRVVLEHEADLAFARADVGDVFAVQHDRARIGILEARDHAQQRGLARARRPEQRDQFARGEVER